jgi:hypothetical protein
MERFKAPITEVVIPEECQSIPITAPNSETKTDLPVGEELHLFHNPSELPQQ